MNIYKSVVALVAGALLSVAVGLFFQVWAPPQDVAIVFEIVMFALVIIAILYVSNTFSKLHHRFELWMRGRNKLIGILNDAGKVKDGINSSFTGIHPSEWKQEIEQAAQADSLVVRVQLITTRNNFVRYSAILNPYGGAYPEPDASRLETLDKILEYVNEGGLFINVADIPGYWAYNSHVGRIFETPPPTYASDSNAQSLKYLFSLVPFTQKLGLEVRNVEGTPLQNWDGAFEAHYGLRGRTLVVYRAVVIEKNVIPIMQQKSFNNKNFTPVFLVNYGSGQCMVSLPPLNNNINQQGDFMKQQLTKILLNIVCKKK